MQTVSEVMTRDIRFVTPQENLQRAAQLMDELNVGALPVCDEDRLVGMVTDRDITIRATAAGRNPQEAHVEEVMSTEVRWCFDDQPLDDVMTEMADSQVRRIPVLSHDSAQKLVGIVSLGDVVTKTGDGGQKQDVQQVVEKVSSPSEPEASATSASASGDEASQVAKTPMGRTPASGTDSGGAGVPSGGDNGTGSRGLAGSGTAGGKTSEGNAAPPRDTGTSDDPNALGPAGDYSR